MSMTSGAPKGWFTTGRVIGLVALALVLAIGSIGAGLYGYANSTRTTGRTLEYQIVAQYQQDQNELSTGVTQILEMMQVANIKKDALKDIITSAVQGRYGKEGFKANGAFFAAVHEQYPVIDLSTYDRVVTKIEQTRESFKNKQDKRADMVRAYNTFRTDGIVRNYFASQYFPSDAMAVTVAGEKFTKQAALDKVSQLVVTTDAQDAFKTGTLKPLNLKGQ